MCPYHIIYLVREKQRSGLPAVVDTLKILEQNLDFLGETVIIQLDKLQVLNVIDSFVGEFFAVID